MEHFQTWLGAVFGADPGCSSEILGRERLVCYLGCHLFVHLNRYKFKFSKFGFIENT